MRTQQVHWDWVALAERVRVGEQQAVAHVRVQLLVQRTNLMPVAHEQAVEVRHLVVGVPVVVAGVRPAVLARAFVKELDAPRVELALRRARLVVPATSNDVRRTRK